MAKRRDTDGKKGKHKRESAGFTGDYAARRRKMILTAVIVTVVIIILASVLYVFILSEEPVEEKDVLATTTPSNKGYPTDDISYSMTLYNPGRKSDIYSTMVTGLPADWDVDIPATISAGSKKSVNQAFTISPSPQSALNKTYQFTLTVTSGNTQQSYSVSYEMTIFQAFYGVKLLSFNNSHEADPGRAVRYALLVKNTGNGEEEMVLSVNESHIPQNWTVTFEFDSISVPGFQSRVVICTIQTYQNTSQGRYDIMVYATSGAGNSSSVWLNTSLTRTFGSRTVVQQDKISINYMGVFPEGVIFDTSIFEIANNSDFEKTPDYQPKPSSLYSPLKVYIGPSDPDPNDDYTQVITGFWEGCLGLKEWETTVVRIPPEKAYTQPGQDLYGKTLIFEITVVQIS